MCSLLLEDQPLLRRISVAQDRYQVATGRFPTRIILTADDLDELNWWVDACPGHPAYMTVYMSNEPEILGMRYRVESNAKELRVYFQES